MTRPKITYWTLSVEGSVKVAGSDFVAASLKDNIHVSPTTKLCSSTKRCMLESETLANEFATALLPIIEKRQKTAVEIRVEPVTTSGTLRDIAKDEEKIAAHSHEVRERLRTGNFAPNKAV